MFFPQYERCISSNAGRKLFIDITSHRPTSLDIIFAAHTHVLTSLDLPDNSLKDLLVNSYPTLVAHATSVYEKAFPNPNVFPPMAVASLATSLKSLVPYPKLIQRAPQRPKLDLSSDEEEDAKESVKEERQFQLARWAWTGLAVSSIAGYLYFTGLGGIMLSSFFGGFMAVVEADDDEEDGALDDDVDDGDAEEHEEVAEDVQE